MWFNLALGSLVICGTILIHVAGLLALTRATALANVNRKSLLTRVVRLTVVVLGLFATVGLEIWLWAFGRYRLPRTSTQRCTCRPSRSLPSATADQDTKVSEVAVTG